MVSGCFDMLHSGHVRFLQEAASYGDVYVALASSETIKRLKYREPVYTTSERRFVLEALKYVKEVHVSPGDGLLDFAPLLHEINPDIFFVNDDGDFPEKRELIERLGIRYIVHKRVPAEGLPVRSTTDLLLWGGW